MEEGIDWNAHSEGAGSGKPQLSFFGARRLTAPALGFVLFGLAALIAPGMAQASPQFTDSGTIPQGGNGSVFADLDNDGDVDLVVAGTSICCSGGAAPLRVFSNNGTGTFTEAYNNNLNWSNTMNYQGVKLTDYDLDGDLDILTNGPDPDKGLVFYRNDGNLAFTSDLKVAVGESMGRGFTVVDLNSDGREDILNSSGSRIYKNTGNGFEQVTVAAPFSGTISYKGLDFKDYDKDGLLDLVALSSGKIAVFKNQGQFKFTKVFEESTGLKSNGQQIFSDVDGDGDLDILAADYSDNQGLHILKYDGVTWALASTVPSPNDDGFVDIHEFDMEGDGDHDYFINMGFSEEDLVYVNDGAGNLTMGQGFGVFNGGETDAIADIDGDNDLDIFSVSHGTQNKIWKNNATIANTAPGTPVALDTADITTGPCPVFVPLRWSAPQDDHTPANLLSYNLKIGTTAGSGNIFSGITPPGPGIAGYGLSKSLAVVDGGEGTQTYFWSVQAVDNLFKKSAFSAEDSFTVVTDCTGPVTTAITDEGDTTSSGTQLSASWAAFTDIPGGVGEYSYSIGVSAGDTSVKDWTSNGLNTTVTATGLNLTQSGNYFINVRAKDVYGNLGAVASSNGITVNLDSTPPTGGTVTDEGEFTASTTQLSASWTGFTDASGVAAYSYSIGVSAGDTSVKDWTSAGTNQTATVTGLTLSYGRTYFFNVRAVDTLGNLGSAVSSDGVTVETFAGDVELDGDVDLNDALLANRMAAGNTSATAQHLRYGDLQEPKDGKITTEDANLILRCVMNLIRGNAGYAWCAAAAREATAFEAAAGTGGAP